MDILVLNRVISGDSIPATISLSEMLLSVVSLDKPLNSREAGCLRRVYVITDGSVGAS